MTSRWTRFLTIGLLGFLLQLGALATLTSGLHWMWLPSTIVAVELAVIHNFVWHARWTWRDRPGNWPARFVRFQLANGAASIAGNALLMVLFVGLAGLPAVPANILSVAAMSVVNFLAADRWVFPRRRDGEKTGEISKNAGSRMSFLCGLRVLRGFFLRGSQRAAIVCAVCVLSVGSARAQAPDTIEAWNRYVMETEGRLERARAARRPRPPVTDTITASGASLRVPGGTISDWQGCVFIRGITLDRLLHLLQHPGTPPPQEDVISARVLGRSDDSLRLAIRLARRAIVTVTYDTEHEMRFHRWTPRLATARSVATRIEEVGGSDHGFLWRLHSYWIYEEIDGGVLVELQSLTLSRDVPSIIRPIATPLVNRIARESMTRTLEALQRFLLINVPVTSPVLPAQARPSDERLPEPDGRRADDASMRR
jgi:putative flippase GtrA